MPDDDGSSIARAASSLLPMRTVPYPLLLLSGPKLTSARSTVPAFRKRSFRSCQRTRYGSWNQHCSRAECDTYIADKEVDPAIKPDC